MDIIRNPKEFQERCWNWRCAGLNTVLVPSMGFFHEGHLRLMDAARQRAGSAGKAMVSLFVNPTQFGPSEDLAAYPRDFERDRDLAESRGVDVLFAPEPEAMYAPDAGTWVEVPSLSTGLCGVSRPIHFRGVATVVSKLLLLAMPRAAIFGQKDWQQLAVIRRMVRDLNIPVEIVGHPIVREADGLALSSRNVYLTPEERRLAPEIHAGLEQAREAVQAGEASAERIVAAFATHLAKKIPAARIDYAQIVHPDSLAPLECVDGPALMVVAVFLGKARLIDNMLLRT
ncbi:pantoate--beta-alanine ligase [Desulfocurvibacter africanus]|uniref:Pantothenate synthetase n=1 Tax=Desulfocurvibacter africanus subsp. africanus str. Walvis Bay TaxID=690850 RepID=F3YX26_DESAF|nr:pantoate--beta-alanine ligase [Desulfocurvibacter africanus]EGJ49414.1 Pantothenate synthetase [Desulfocurvibacter africanus subsp. africanus str. Walvis Bay]